MTTLLRVLQYLRPYRFMVIGTFLFAGLTTTLGLGVVSMALVGAVIAAVWCLCGLFLGKHFEANNKSEAINQELLEEQSHSQV